MKRLHALLSFARSRTTDRRIVSGIPAAADSAADSSPCGSILRSCSSARWRAARVRLAEVAEAADSASRTRRRLPVIPRPCAAVAEGAAVVTLAAVVVEAEGAATQAAVTAMVAVTPVVVEATGAA